jgi:peptide/nickel transport system substrate-binding protein
MVESKEWCGVTRRSFLWGSALALTATTEANLLPYMVGRASAAGSDLTIQFPEDFGQLDPGFWQGNADLLMIENVFPKLTRLKPGAELGWELSAAESIEQIDPLRVRFKLRPGILWTGDFGEVTTEDVKYSFERFIDPKLAAPSGSDWGALDKVEVIDKYAGIIHLKRPSAPIWWSVLPYSAGAIVCKKAVEALGGKFTTDPGATAGPYKIASWAPGDRIVLAAHEYWGGPKPAYDTITVLPITDLKAAELAFQAGQVELAQISLSSVRELQANLPKGTKLGTRPTWGYLWLGLNMTNPDLADPRVRQAIIKAVDAEGVNQGAFYGLATVANGLIAPGLIGHRDTPPKRDVEGARALLKEAGVTSLTLNLEISNGPDEQTTAQIIQANLAEIGVNVNINVHDIGSFWSLASEIGEKMQLSLQRFTSPADPSWSTQWFLSDQAGVWNWQWFRSDEYDKLHLTAMQELDPHKRGEMYKRMQALMDESASFLFLLHPSTPVLYRASLEPSQRPNGDLDLRNFRRAG